jgi:hypothetical protein
VVSIIPRRAATRDNVTTAVLATDHSRDFQDTARTGAI